MKKNKQGDYQLLKEKPTKKDGIATEPTTEQTPWKPPKHISFETIQLIETANGTI